MIGRLCGEVVECQPTHLILDVQGVGYEIHIPLSTFQTVQKPGTRVTLNTYLHVREDALQLYGFASSGEKELFKSLIGISGIGPKVALGILSKCSVEEFHSIVGSHDVSRLKALPGIGKKTAERLILELKDSLADFDGMPVAAAGVRGSSVAEEAKLALVSLGYSRSKVHTIIYKLLDENAGASAEMLIKDALRLL